MKLNHCGCEEKILEEWHLQIGRIVKSVVCRYLSELAKCQQERLHRTNSTFISICIPIYYNLLYLNLNFNIIILFDILINTITEFILAVN